MNLADVSYFRSVIVGDPNLLEENTAEAHLILGLNSYKELCGLHLGGSAMMSVEDIQSYAQKGAKRAHDVVQQIKKVLEEDAEKRFVRTQFLMYIKFIF